MGASFRNVRAFLVFGFAPALTVFYLFKVGEIKALAGVDFLTISPSLLEELKKSTDPVPKKLDSTAGKSSFSLGPTHSALDLIFRTSQIAAQADPIPKVTYIDNEPEFRWDLLQDQMAFDKLHEGIKKFAEDGETLKKLLRAKISAQIIDNLYLVYAGDDL